MKIFFLKSVSGVAHEGEIKEVSEGYAKNFLFPKKLAVLYDLQIAEKIKQIEKKSNKIEKKRSGLFDEIENTVISIPVVLKNDVMYGSVSAQDIVDALSLKELSVTKSQVLLDKPIKKIGTFFISIKLSNSLIPVLKVKVIPQK